MARCVAHVLYSSALTVTAVICKLQKRHSHQAALAVFLAAADFHVCVCATALQSDFVSDTESMIFIRQRVNQI